MLTGPEMSHGAELGVTDHDSSRETSAGAKSRRASVLGRGVWVTLGAMGVVEKVLSCEQDWLSLERAH